MPLSHLGIIIDGNRRWAKENGLSSLEGHKKGFEKVKELINWAKNKKIKTLTIFCFSTENWNRSKVEVNYLMNLAKNSFDKYFDKLGKDNIQIKVIGEQERLPLSLQKSIAKIEKLTEKNKSLLVNLALNYGGRAELVSAIKNIISKKIPANKITENVVSENLWTTDLDMIIRTGKEQRISNFLIWQGAYSELYFSQKYWPDFTEKDFDSVLEDYKKRSRRFGK